MATGSGDIFISVVSPVYKAEKIVDELVRRIVESVSQITSGFEIILVDDCGPDDSWQKIVENCERDSRVKGIKLSRNFGQHAAITAGLDSCRGEWVVVMDCDLQDRPEEIPRLLQKAQQGYDIVFAQRIERQDSFFKRLSSKLFYKAFSYLSGIDQDGTIANFGIYSGKAVKAFNSMREPVRAFSPMMRWVGFNKTAIEVEHSSRFEGKSSYNWSRLISLALNIALAYSDKPLHLITNLGFIISSLSILSGFYYIGSYLTGHIKIAGFASTIIFMCFMFGLTIFIMGIIGLYISKIFDAVKNRPIYIENHKINF